MPLAVIQGATESTDADPQAEIERLRDKIERLEERVRTLDHLAHQDALLDLPNRRGFLRALKMLIDRVGRYDESAAMLFVDIDGLKQINDSYGHKAGDAALAQVAELLTKGVRKSDYVARIGGDEFGVLLAHADEASANETADRLMREIEAHEAECEGNSLALGAAIGVTVIEAGDDPDSVMTRSDRAMYERKAAA